MKIGRRFDAVAISLARLFLILCPDEHEKINGASIEDALKFGRSAGMTTLEGVVKARLSED